MGVTTKILVHLVWVLSYQKHITLKLPMLTHKEFDLTANALDQYLRERSVGRISKISKVRWSIERDPLII